MLSVLRGNLKFKYLFFNEYSYLQPFLHVERAFELQEFSVSFPLLWGQERRHFNILSLDMNCCVNVVYFSERADSYG